jgi:hypothetical protein
MEREKNTCTHKRLQITIEYIDASESLINQNIKFEVDLLLSLYSHIIQHLDSISARLKRWYEYPFRYAVPLVSLHRHHLTVSKPSPQYHTLLQMLLLPQTAMYSFLVQNVAFPVEHVRRNVMSIPVWCPRMTAEARQGQLSSLDRARRAGELCSSSVIGRESLAHIRCH